MDLEVADGVAEELALAVGNTVGIGRKFSGIIADPADVSLHVREPSALMFINTVERVV